MNPERNITNSAFSLRSTECVGLFELMDLVLVLGCPQKTAVSEKALINLLYRQMQLKTSW